jgi:NAD(P)-dependent dehydrogenase (short-subunit alcohol dehydrogenase family)
MLRGKIAIVTGGLSGIGQAIAQRMAAEGARVIAADIMSDGRDLLDQELSPFHVDVSDPQSVAKLVDAVVQVHGRVDCLVNSAGIAKEIPFLDTPVETFDQIIAVNLRGTFVIGQAVARAMRDHGVGGSIVNIASVSGIVGNAGRTAYGTSKGGVITLTRVMSVDLAPYKIRVNAIAPGPVDTPMVKELHKDARRSQWTNLVPLRRYARPEEIAGTAVFLCSDDASYITGHVLVADGGLVSSRLLP